MIALTIAGSDSGGGAGIQADIKTFQEHGVFGTSALTALTAQNTCGVHDVMAVTAQFLGNQLHAVLEDFSVKAIKTGMLVNAALMKEVAHHVQTLQVPLVVDPVMIAKGGEHLMEDEAVETLRNVMLPLATVCTPNIPEAERLTGKKIASYADMKRAAHQLLSLGVQCVVMKGGHLHEKAATDYVFMQSGEVFALETPRIDTKQTHGTGCTFSAAVTAQLAKGKTVRQAIIEAKKYIHLAIAYPLHIGHGYGPTNHFAYRQQLGQCEVHYREY